MAPSRVFSNGYPSRHNLAGDLHFNPTPKLAPEITTNISPVFPGDFSESDPQSSRGSVKKSGGQSNSVAPFASFSFRSKAVVAANVLLALGGGIAMIESRPFP